MGTSVVPSVVRSTCFQSYLHATIIIKQYRLQKRGGLEACKDVSPAEFDTKSDAFVVTPWLGTNLKLDHRRGVSVNRYLTRRAGSPAPAAIGSICAASAALEIDGSRYVALLSAQRYAYRCERIQRRVVSTRKSLPTSLESLVRFMATRDVREQGPIGRRI